MGEIALDASQVSAAKILLGKALPDLASVQHSGQDGDAIKHEFKWID